jgi:uncharacterized protein YndB with AHSA1/START domain
MQASATIDIDRPIEDVFEYVSDPYNMEAWVTGVSGVTLVDADPSRVGARFESDYTYGGRTVRMAYEVTASDPPERYATRGEGPYPFAGELTLEPTSGGTRVTNTVGAASDGRFTSVTFTLFGPVIRRLMARRLREELVSLRSELEGRVVTAPTA